MYYVYILKSLTHNKTYAGITDDLRRRLSQHNAGYHFYTKRHRPWEIVYVEQKQDRSEARKRERYFKSSAGRKWLMKNVFNK